MRLRADTNRIQLGGRIFCTVGKAIGWFGVKWMNTILVVEDEQAIREMLCLCLRKSGYACETAENGAQAAAMIEQRHYELVLLDVMLPDYDGYELIDYIRQYDTPVIFVTARAEILDRVKGLRAGAEDYIVKPFDLRELTARVENVLRRYRKTDACLLFGRIAADTVCHTVTLDGAPVALSAKEYELFVFFARNPHIALTREQIYENVWREPYYGGTRTVDLHVQRLKKKLWLGGAIETLYKVGYRFSPEKLP